MNKCSPDLIRPYSKVLKVDYIRNSLIMEITEHDKFIYEVVKDRYNQEMQITGDLDSKANSVTGFSGLLATLMGAVAGYFPKGHYTLLLAIPIVLLIISAILGMLGYWVKPYDAIKPVEFITAYKDKTATETLREYTATIAKATNTNRKTNAGRAGWIKWASTLLVSAIGLFFVFTIINWLL
jgi:hypothetical protein